MENENLHNNPDLIWDQEEIKTQELLDEITLSYDDVALDIDTIKCFGDLLNAAGLSQTEILPKTLNTSGWILNSAVKKIDEAIDVDTPDNYKKIDAVLDKVKAYADLLLSAGVSETVVTKKTLETLGLDLMDQAKELEKLFS